MRAHACQQPSTTPIPSDTCVLPGYLLQA